MQTPQMALLSTNPQIRVNQLSGRERSRTSPNALKWKVDRLGRGKVTILQVSHPPFVIGIAVRFVRFICGQQQRIDAVLLDKSSQGDSQLSDVVGALNAQSSPLCFRNRRE